MQYQLQRIEEFASRYLKPTSDTAAFMDKLRSVVREEIVKVDDRIRIGPTVYRFIDEEAATTICGYLETYFDMVAASPKIKCED